MGYMWDYWSPHSGISFHFQDNLNMFDAFPQLDTQAIFAKCDPRSDQRVKGRTALLPYFGRSKTGPDLNGLSLDQSSYVTALGVAQDPTRRSKRLVGHPVDCFRALIQGEAASPDNVPWHYDLQSQDNTNEHLLRELGHYTPSTHVDVNKKLFNVTNPACD